MPVIALYSGAHQDEYIRCTQRPGTKRVLRFSARQRQLQGKRPITNRNVHNMARSVGISLRSQVGVSKTRHISSPCVSPIDVTNSA